MKTFCKITALLIAGCFIFWISWGAFSKPSESIIILGVSEDGNVVHSTKIIPKELRVKGKSRLNDLLAKEVDKYNLKHTVAYDLQDKIAHYQRQDRTGRKYILLAIDKISIKHNLSKDEKSNLVKAFDASIKKFSGKRSPEKM